MLKVSAAPVSTGAGQRLSGLPWPGRGHQAQHGRSAGAGGEVPAGRDGACRRPWGLSGGLQSGLSQRPLELQPGGPDSEVLSVRGAPPAVCPDEGTGRPPHTGPVWPGNTSHSHHVTDTLSRRIQNRNGSGGNMNHFSYKEILVTFVLLCCCYKWIFVWDYCLTPSHLVQSSHVRVLLILASFPEPRLPGWETPCERTFLTPRLHHLALSQ